MRAYRPRRMPARYMTGAPPIVRRNVLDITGPYKNAVCEYDVLFYPPEPDPETITGLDFDGAGWRGCHFELDRWQTRRYRERNRRRRVAWLDLPEKTRKAVVAYLEWTPE